MFLGHFAVAFAAKKVAPKTSLGTLILGAQAVDLLWPIFLLLGIEKVRITPGITTVTPLDFYDYPITHSLLAAFVWAVVVGLCYYAFRPSRRETMTVGVVVFSHWILDFITHRPDLPLGFGTEKYFGLGLWNSIAGTLLLELAMFAAGMILYLRSTQAKDKIGMYGFWALAAFLVVVYLANVFGPPPPSETAIAIAGNAGWLFVLFGHWFDRHRIINAVSAVIPQTNSTT
ncbi:MAG TPA: hypothetical protein DCP63_11560 [Bacteroidetes bacterium]|nr:hypothetical protein [Bacteroidota bacterium]